MNRVNVFAIHRCINEGYGFIQIFTEKIRISSTKLWHVCSTSTQSVIECHLIYVGTVFSLTVKAFFDNGMQHTLGYELVQKRVKLSFFAMSSVRT